MAHSVVQQYNISYVESVQQAAARMLMGKPHQWKAPDSVLDMISILKWPSLEERRKCSSVTLIYRVINGYIAIPQCYHPAPISHQYTTHTGSNPHALQHYESTNDVFQYSFFPRTIPCYNALPVDVTSAPSLDAFRSRLVTVTPLM